MSNGEHLMGKVVTIDELRKARLQSRRKSTLCQEGHHRWRVIKDKRFDVKRGKLVTVYRCERCGKEKTTAH